MIKKKILFLPIFLITILMFTGCSEKEFLREESLEVVETAEVGTIEQTRELEKENIVSIEETVQEETIQVNEIQFPLVMEEGKLEVSNVFRFDGINPDCNNQEGSNIATIEVKNLSNIYLSKADITIKTYDGILLCFQITDLPAGKTAWVFASDNVSIGSDVMYSDIVCEAIFDSDASMNDDKISIFAEGTIVDLQNNTNTELKEIVVYYHSSLGEQYFGGITYNYTLNDLPAGGTAEMNAKECVLGFAEVVRVEINE